MTYATLMNWEICLDAAGIFCCILSVLYLIRLKRKAEMNSRIPGPIQREDVSPFKATPIDLPEDMSFVGVLASVTRDSRMAVDAGGGGGGLPRIRMMRSGGFWIWAWRRIRLRRG